VVHPVVLPAPALSQRPHPLLPRIEYVGSESSISVSQSIIILSECPSRTLRELDASLNSIGKAIVAVGIARALKSIIETVGYYPGRFGIDNVKIDYHHYPIISFIGIGPSMSDEATVLASFNDVLKTLQIEPCESFTDVIEIFADRDEVRAFDEWVEGISGSELCVNCSGDVHITVPINRYIFEKPHHARKSHCWLGWVISCYCFMPVIIEPLIPCQKPPLRWTACCQSLFPLKPLVLR
jgi:hypothetical protein